MRITFLILLLTLITFSCKEDEDEGMVFECVAPKNIQFSELSINSVLLTWDANNSSSYTIEYGVSGFNIGSGSVVNVSDSNFLLTSLDSDTAYNVYIRSRCEDSQVSAPSDLLSFSTLSPEVVAEFLPKLSELNLFSGNMSDLKHNSRAFEYTLSTALFSDYSKKNRIIALPEGTSMAHINDGLPNFPDNSVMAKTFFYNKDDRDETLGRRIIETRVFIKINGEWKSGNYIWDEAQTDAVFTTESSQIPINYVDDIGDTRNIDYVIPSASDCIKCHSKGEFDIMPIGPKLRSININNQIEELITANYLTGLIDVSSISKLPKWDDNSYSVEERARAYFDMQCAHCHSEGGATEDISPLRLSYETALDASFIPQRGGVILERTEFFGQGFSMPSLGTTMIHKEGFELMKTYIDSL